MYEVGQVLYTILQKRHKIMPVQVVEQIVRRTISGEKIQYLVRVPGHESDVDLETFGDQVFEDIVSVKSTLRGNIFKVIDEMTEKAIGIASEHFGVSESSTKDLSPIDQPGSEDVDVVKVQLDDGQIANVKFPSIKAVS